MGKITLYHGTPEKVVIPTCGLGDDKHDYGRGFYLTEDAGLAKEWIGEFYAYYQWYYNMPSADVIKAVPLKFLMRAYGGLHDLDLELAVEKVGKK